MIDHEKAMILYRRGYTQSRISREMGCSSKQVGRIIRDHRSETDKAFHKTARNGDQDKFYVIMVYSGYSVDYVAKMIGRSRQHINKILDDWKQNSVLHELKKEIF